MTAEQQRKEKFRKIIITYPFALLAISLAANALLFGIAPTVPALPPTSVIAALVIAALLLLLNHSWLMTSTELTRLKFNMHATPEEWDASEHSPKDVTPQARQELERHHNAHRNATENTVYFVFLALLISMVSPVVIAAQIWIVGFALGRLGHMFCFLTGKDGARGIFMSISLTSLYGMASYLAVSLFL